ncbi:MAG: L-threonylcarbamoyladenylate synthase [Nitrospirae bacterium]|nr:L-threonylcarbamoyladenylate synthase [Nitrospirota bacterium]MCL5977113.1 L-threonylcarbamoyladenylate synthase [Nitrospirota bacterium]
MILQLTDKNIDEAIRSAITVLKNGGIVAYPTETFYALGVKYDIEPALKRLYEIKQRPKEKAMPLIIGRVEQLPLLTNCISDSAKELMTKFWPGPLTILFNARCGLSGYITSGGKAAVRVPGESFALELAKTAEFPITATSANISGMPPADSASMITDYFDDAVDLIIDGGRTKGGLPSTIVYAAEGKIKIVRKGAADIQSNLI